MDLSFANLAGLWALLGIPAVLAIHAFQRRARRVPISTLFLLEPSPPRSRPGRRFERLRGSVSLWLQLGAVLLVTWLLVEPRWLRDGSVHRSVVVLDDSMSMDAFRPEALQALENLVQRASGLARRTEWALLSSDVRARPLYTGSDGQALLRAVRSWRPRLGAHDARPALRIARDSAGRGGQASFLTDHLEPSEEGIELIAVGSPIDNVGFAGLAIDDGAGGPRWRALVRNYGRSEAARAWRIEASGARGAGGEVRLAAGAGEILTGLFPAGNRSLELILDADAFAVDDRLPIVLPAPKPLTVALEPAARELPFISQFVATLDAVRSPDPGTRADLTLGLRGAGSREPFAGPASRSPRQAILFLSAPPSGRYLEGPLVAENDPLMEDLTFQGLLVRDSAAIPPAPEDRVLLWQGTRPLILLRSRGEAATLVGAASGATSDPRVPPPGGEPAGDLIVDFPLEASNAARLPSFVLLLHRFAEQARRAKAAYERANVATNQLLDLVAAAGGGPITVTAGAGDGAPRDASRPAPGVVVTESQEPLLRAPQRPGFFRVRQGTRVLFEGAAQFTDPREADLRFAARREPSARSASEIRTRNSRPDPLGPLWLVLLGFVLVTDWTLLGRRA